MITLSFKKYCSVGLANQKWGKDGYYPNQIAGNNIFKQLSLHHFNYNCTVFGFNILYYITLDIYIYIYIYFTSINFLLSKLEGAVQQFHRKSCKMSCIQVFSSSQSIKHLWKIATTHSSRLTITNFVYSPKYSILS